MITSDPYGITKVIKPGHMPEPLEPVHTCDPQHIIDLCLDCKVPGGCNQLSHNCPLRKVKEKTEKKKQWTLDRDEQIARMVNRGASAREIAGKFKISERMVSEIKRRLVRKGKIDGTRERTAKMLERDEKILYLLTHGWRNTEAICEELKISTSTLTAAKKRLRERGMIP